MKKMRVRPIGENVLVQLEKPEQKTAAGIYLPETAKEERSQFGKVVAIGESEKIRVKTGERVIFRLYGGEEVTVSGERYLLTSYKDILAVVAE
ncbi:MAG: co-chaperone GroES [Candidatus Moranbacteria bacterium]|nr:co-chaperone GroES [Candidatus Moranbacteria bacterium]